MPTPMPPTPAPTPVPPNDCIVSEWGQWGACSKPCKDALDTPLRSRTRFVQRFPAGAGAPCPSLRESEPCNQDVDCTVCNCSGCRSSGYLKGSKDWCRCCRFNDNTICRTTAQQTSACGTNNNYEFEGCKRDGFCEFNAADKTTRYCGRDKRPLESWCDPFVPVDCKVSEWTVWSGCSKACISDGGAIAANEIPYGTRTRSRQVEIPPIRGGLACPSNLSEAESCNDQVCPQDCLLSEWTPYGECSRECGGGSRRRQRIVLVRPNATGDRCGARTEIEECNAQPCPIDCEVSVWTSGECMLPEGKTCGDGEANGTRTIVTQPDHGGEACPALTGLLPCIVPCPTTTTVATEPATTTAAIASTTAAGVTTTGAAGATTTTAAGATTTTAAGATTTTAAGATTTTMTAPAPTTTAAGATTTTTTAVGATTTAVAATTTPAATTTVVVPVQSQSLAFDLDAPRLALEGGALQYTFGERKVNVNSKDADGNDIPVRISDDGSVHVANGGLTMLTFDTSVSIERIVLGDFEEGDAASLLLGDDLPSRKRAIIELDGDTTVAQVTRDGASEYAIRADNVDTSFTILAVDIAQPMPAAATTTEVVEGTTTEVPDTTSVVVGGDTTTSVADAASTTAGDGADTTAAAAGEVCGDTTCADNETCEDDECVPVAAVDPTENQGLLWWHILLIVLAVVCVLCIIPGLFCYMNRDHHDGTQAAVPMSSQESKSTATTTTVSTTTKTKPVAESSSEEYSYYEESSASAAPKSVAKAGKSAKAAVASSEYEESYYYEETSEETSSELGTNKETESGESSSEYESEYETEEGETNEATSEETSGEEGTTEEGTTEASEYEYETEEGDTEEGTTEATEASDEYTYESEYESSEPAPVVKKSSKKGKK